MNLMLKTATGSRLWLAAFLTLCCSLPLAQAQGVFRAELDEQRPSSNFFGGAAFFSIGSEVGYFQVAVLYPFGGNLTPTIHTAAGALTFSLGVGTKRYWCGCDPFSYNPFLPAPIGPHMGPSCDSCFIGTNYVGSFISSPEVFAELAAGRGEFRMVSDSGVVLNGLIEIEPIPLLTISRRGSSDVELNWATNLIGYHLDYAESIPATLVWNAVTNIPSVVGSNFSVTLPNNGDQRFFRLRRP